MKAIVIEDFRLRVCWVYKLKASGFGSRVEGKAYSTTLRLLLRKTKRSKAAALGLYTRSSSSGPLQE